MSIVTPIPSIETLVLSVFIALTIGATKKGSAWFDRQPTLTRPLLGIGLAFMGTKLCTSLSAACSGNPLGWDSPQAAIFASAMYGIVVREGWVWLRPRYERVLAGLRRVKP